VLYKHTDVTGRDDENTATARVTRDTTLIFVHFNLSNRPSREPTRYVRHLRRKGKHDRRMMKVREMSGNADFDNAASLKEGWLEPKKVTTHPMHVQIREEIQLTTVQV